MKKTVAPLGISTQKSEFSIANLFAEKEKEEIAEPNEKQEKLPQNHFSETDLQTEWLLFLKKIQKEDSLAFNAIKSFKIDKKGESEIEITYTSDSAKEEFEKHKATFINNFKHKVQNYAINIICQKVEGMAKVEVMTQRKKFEKLIEINPLLKELNDVLNFDFS